MGGRAGAHQRAGALGRGPGRPDPRARSPRRRPRRRRRLAAAPVQRRDPRGSALGSRCRGHEGLRRDAALHGACPCPGGRRARPAAGALLHRRRGGRGAPRRRTARGVAPRVVRGLHVRRRRGRRVLHDGAGPPALPHRGRGEGDGLDAVDRARQRRARIDAAPRQRGDHARRGRGPHRSARVARPAHPDDAGAARGRRRAGRHRGHSRERGGPRRGVRAALPACSAP